jgi:D-alanyl-lipoteichoic acid acyltransferase DltB (MBOAT superfamily)
MSYSIDVYYGRIKAEKHLGIFAIFVTFFPQLVAVPIERTGNLLRQLKEKHEFNYGRLTNGLKLMVWGLFKTKNRDNFYNYNYLNADGADVFTREFSKILLRLDI